MIPHIYWQELLVRGACTLAVWAAVSFLVVLAVDEIAGP